MKTKPILLLAAIAAGLIVSAAAVGALVEPGQGSATPAAASAAGEVAAINSARLRQNAAIVANRVDEVASYWTDEVTICRGLGVQLAGKAAYRKLFEADIGSPARIVYERLPSAIEVSPHWPLAFETGAWNGHVGSLSGPTIISGRYSAQWVKRGDQWLIRAEVYVALDGAGVGLESKAAP